MVETRLSVYDNFWLGPRGPAKKAGFYRLESRATHAPQFNGSQYGFTLSQNQRVVTYTHQSIMDFIQIAPVFLFTVFKFLRSMSDRFSVFNFKIDAINKLFTVKKRKNRKKNKKKYGSMKLTTSQYLRLLCVMTLPFERCCLSGKEKETEHAEEPEAQTINEGDEQIDSGK